MGDSPFLGKALTSAAEFVRSFQSGWTKVIRDYAKDLPRDVLSRRRGATTRRQRSGGKPCNLLVLEGNLSSSGKEGICH